MGEKTSANRIQELDALRGIAALMVVLFHYNSILKEKGFFLLKLGVTGVDLFFMISGFVIFMSLRKIKSSDEFIINRFSRLYPTYWTCVTITFLLSIYIGYHDYIEINFMQYLANMTMFQLYFKKANIDGTYWTMIVEMLFYITILILYKFKSLKYLNLIGLSSCIFILFITRFYSNTSIVRLIINYFPLSQFLPLFFSGILFYKIYRAQKHILINYLLIAFCLISQIVLFDLTGVSRYFLSIWSYSSMLLLYFILFYLFINNKLIFIVSNITIFLGKISFALYLIHEYISVEIILPYLTKQLNINFWISAIFITLPLVILLATLITYYIEIPLGKGMKQKLRSLANHPRKPILL